jgi:hypothetical protein
MFHATVGKKGKDEVFADVPQLPDHEMPEFYCARG